MAVAHCTGIAVEVANGKKKSMFGKYFGSYSSGDLTKDEPPTTKLPGLLYPRESESREV